MAYGTPAEIGVDNDTPSTITTTWRLLGDILDIGNQNSLGNASCSGLNK